MREERETCTRTKTQNIVTFSMITISKRSWAEIAAFKQLFFRPFFDESKFGFAFLHLSREAHQQTCCFPHHDLENKVTAQTCRSCGFSASIFLMHVESIVSTVVGFVFF